jgi:hypothetical protein
MIPIVYYNTRLRQDFLGPLKCGVVIPHHFKVDTMGRKPKGFKG